MQEKMRWENTYPCPVIIFFNLFLSSRHAVKNIFSFSGSSPCPRGLWSQDQRKAKKLWRFFSPSHNRVNRKSKFKVLIEFNFSVCFVIQSAMSAREKLFHFVKRKGTESSMDHFSLRGRELFPHFKIKGLRFIDKHDAHYRRHFLIAESNRTAISHYVIRSLQLTNQVPFQK